MDVSIIIPALNEAANIERLISHLIKYGGEKVADLLVVDGGSSDDTVSIARRAGAQVLRSPRAGRAVQMNYGACSSEGVVLLFVHADTLPPPTYIKDIQQAVRDGHPIGCFRSTYESDNFLLRINAFFTRFDFLWVRGGDQAIFITRPVFEELGGYREDHIIMEEYDLILRARKSHPFRIIPKDVLISARKYEDNNYLRVQIANFIVFNMFRLGCSQQSMANTYRKLLKYR